jgi:hypothetical protein
MAINDSTVHLQYGMEKLTPTTTPFKLGQRGSLPDGRVFRLARAGQALAAGQVCQAAVQPNDGEWDMDIPISTDLAAVGARDIPVDQSGATLTSALAADAYKDGWLYVNDGPGQGHVYRVSSHPSMTTVNATALTVRLAYDDVIQSTGLTTVSLVGLVQNSYNSVVPTDLDTTLTQILGVSVADAASSDYTWLQTWGPASVLTADNPAVPTVGRSVVPNITTSDEAGSVAGVSTAFTSDAQEPDRDTPTIGYGMAIASVAIDYGLVFLTIAS